MRDRSHYHALLLAIFVIAGLPIFEPVPQPMALYEPSAALPDLALGRCAWTCAGETA